MAAVLEEADAVLLKRRRGGCDLHHHAPEPAAERVHVVARGVE